MAPRVGKMAAVSDVTKSAAAASDIPNEVAPAADDGCRPEAPEPSRWCGLTLLGPVTPTLASRQRCVSPVLIPAVGGGLDAENLPPYGQEFVSTSPEALSSANIGPSLRSHLGNMG